ncbi:hypothetical protein [Nitrososphaera viennensis]|uniref:Uncharacterized protein n=2 Tax=Nitrososphaera viennensis TaxID=1034015 RepID=A0A060HGY3_9ARCH|nr:hypothetical protein [Nitrososphaera viennensis]AIC14610.1 hypothetical protein NVIE_004170 [Nitrososphaera viennensis EN76]UVS69574.1 hypothetical protein NWT39_02025 [Nitrososphaera viennensis]
MTTPEEHGVVLDIKRSETMRMKRGHIVLVSGAVLLVSGIAISVVWGVSFAGSFLRDNTIVAKTTIDAGKSVDARTEVNQLDRPISIAISIDRSGALLQQTSSSSDIRLKETVTDPNGRVVNSNEFGGTFFTSFKPQEPGVYTVTVSNLGSKPVTVSGVFGYISFIDSDGQPNMEALEVEGGGLGLVIAGGGMAAAGVLILIVGAIITAIDGRKEKQSGTTATTGENGIRYRKD